MKLNSKFTALIIIIFVIPIAFLTGVIYYNMEQTTIEENISYMEYIMERNAEQAKSNLGVINMTTQFVLSSEKMRNVLNAAVTGEHYGAEELMEFRDTDIVDFERLVNINPLLYGVRIYSVNDNVQEMMPVLYTNSRMHNLEWASAEDVEGWHYGYYDTLFSTLLTSQDKMLMSKVTAMEDYENGTIGVIEVAAEMESVFPSLYENVENEWSCFVSEDGTMYFGKDAPANTPFFMSSVEAQMAATEFLEEDVIETFYAKTGNQKYVISYLYLKEMRGTLISVRNITGEIQEIYRLRNMTVCAALAIVALLTFLVNGIVKHMLKQFYDILKSIRRVQAGDLDVRIENCGKDEMGELGSQINTMLDRIQKLMSDNINREVLVKNSEIRALQNQINAHFIYNVLETIKMMAEIDEEYAISDAITALGKMLRYSMRWISRNVKVNEELEYIRNYVKLMNLRFDYEIILSVNIPEEFMNQEIPKMSLQPIVENAILHGIEEVAEDTTIYIKAYRRGADWMIEITDSGKGMTEEQVNALKRKIAGQIEASGGSGNGIGLKNVQDRITIAFGEKYGLDIVSQLGCFTKVMLHLPYCEADVDQKAELTEREE
ncbi:MAG: sensor histidine kinase [Lachnospiraceae bacterium]|nr:sensor histidine kinase [Lachnospiraceae bacterium]